VFWMIVTPLTTGSLTVSETQSFGRTQPAARRSGACNPADSSSRSKGSSR